MTRSAPDFLAFASLAMLLCGCYPVREQVPPGPGAGTALGGSAPAPVLDPADDPDTVSPVEAGDPPGDAGTLSPGASSGRVGPVSAGPPRPSCCLPQNPRLRAIAGAS